MSDDRKNIDLGSFDDDINKLANDGSYRIKPGRGKKNLKNRNRSTNNNNKVNSQENKKEHVLTNRTYFFMPFYFDNPEDLQDFIQTFEGSNQPDFHVVEDEYKYFFKHITNRLKKPSCYHFCSKDTDDSVAPEWYIPATKLKNSSTGEREELDFKLQFRRTHIYCFQTGVCLLAISVRFNKNEPKDVAEAQYYLKKVGRVFFRKEKRNKGNDYEYFSFLEYAKKIVGEDKNLMFFDHEGEERANVFSYVEVPKPIGSGENTDLTKSYKEQLYYLRNCYKKDYTYDQQHNSGNADFIHYHSKSVAWGISNEAVCCIACPEIDPAFIRNTFFKNFKKQYFSMYIFLLHQKYALYMFMLEIFKMDANRTKEQELEKLQDYKEKLYEFEKNYLFTNITEVPQYQGLYKKIYSIISIKEILKDVHEPIKSVGEMKKEQYEKLMREDDEKQNKILFFLAILGIFSALIDGTQYLGELFGWFGVEDGIVILFKGILSLGIVIYIVYSLLKVKKPEWATKIKKLFKGTDNNKKD